MTEAVVVEGTDRRGSARKLPRVFGRYLLLERLSRGGMGEIFLAKLGEIQGFEKLVIIKKVLPHLAADEEFIKRFIDEASVAIKLQHANIAPVFEVGRVGGEYFLALEYVEGRDLRRVINRQQEKKTRLPPDMCLYICRELASGLAYAHRRTTDDGSSLALVHRDISPPNVMVSFDGEVKIIDFGIAKSASRLAVSRPDIGFGKFGYMAPEQLTRGGKLDRRTDVYAAGVVLYELLTGEILFPFVQGADYQQIARMVTEGKVVPPSKRDRRLNPEIDPIVMKALATQQQDRYQSAEELRDAIQVLLMQLNPTISADTLSQHMHELFGRDVSQEHSLVAQLRAIDVAPFRAELEARHTVTFARAVANEGRRPRPRARKLGRPLLMFFAAACSAMVAGGGLTLGLMRVSQPPIVHGVPTAALPPAPALPAVEETSDEESSSARPSSPRSHRRTSARTVRHPTRATVERTFASVRKEYASFKSAYGQVLESRWNAIVHEATFGRTSKLDRLEVLLESLRQEMSRIRHGR